MLLWCPAPICSRVERWLMFFAYDIWQNFAFYIWEIRSNVWRWLCRIMLKLLVGRAKPPSMCIWVKLSRSINESYFPVSSIFLFLFYAFWKKSMKIEFLNTALELFLICSVKTWVWIEIISIFLAKVTAKTKISVLKIPLYLKFQILELIYEVKFTKIQI
jgi:hypothetical protein